MQVGGDRTDRHPSLAGRAESSQSQHPSSVLLLWLGSMKGRSCVGGWVSGGFLNEAGLRPVPSLLPPHCPHVVDADLPFRLGFEHLLLRYLHVLRTTPPWSTLGKSGPLLSSSKSAYGFHAMWQQRLMAVKALSMKLSPQVVQIPSSSRLALPQTPWRSPYTTAFAGFPSSKLLTQAN